MQLSSHLNHSIGGQVGQHPVGHLLSTLSSYKSSKIEIVLEAIDIQKSFAKTQVLQHINLDVRAGELVSFLGPSGCGKTTLLRIIAGLEHADYGRIFKHNEDITQLSTAKRKCGIVFQNYALFPNLNVADNIAFGLDKKSWSSAQRQARVQELLQLIELPDTADKYPHQLSGGQQQRVALARALAAKPELLLLDEPLSALDALVRVNLRQKIRQIQSQLNLATIMVTHDQEEALSISDRIAVMNQGVIEQLDQPHNIYFKPQTRFVAEFIGTMNFIAGQAISKQQLELCGHYLLSLNHLAFTEAETVEIAFRPEQCQLSAEAPCASEALVIAVQIVTTEFLGAKRRVYCQMQHLEKQTQSLNIEQSKPSKLIQVDIDQQLFPQMSQRMWLQVPLAAIHVFDQRGYAKC